jgi:hypothetical protein
MCARCLLVMGQILAEDNLEQRLLETHLAQPFQVTLSPCLTRPVQISPWRNRSLLTR